MGRALPWGFFGGVGLLCLAAPLHAQDVTAAATAFTAGQQAELNREWARAAEFYELADQISPSPQALRSAAKSRLAAGDRATASTEAEELLRRYPDETGSVALAKGILEQSVAKLSRLDVQCKPACTVGVDRVAISTEPRAGHVVYVDPGEHRVEAFFAGSRSTATMVTGVEGARKEVAFEPTTKATTADPAVPLAGDSPPTADRGTSGGGLPPAVALTGAAITVVLGGITLWSGLDTIKAHNDATSANASGKYSHDVYDDGISREHRTNWLGGATAVVGVATVAVSLLATRWTPSKSVQAADGPSQLSPVSVVVRPEGAGLFWQGSF